jgi:hypothetical protein
LPGAVQNACYSPCQPALHFYVLYQDAGGKAREKSSVAAGECGHAHQRPRLDGRYDNQHAPPRASGSWPLPRQTAHAGRGPSLRAQQPKRGRTSHEPRSGGGPAPPPDPGCPGGKWVRFAEPAPAGPRARTPSPPARRPAPDPGNGFLLQHSLLSASPLALRPMASCCRIGRTSLPRAPSGRTPGRGGRPNGFVL